MASAKPLPKGTSMFSGMSSLREAERKKESKQGGNPALQAYLSKYGDASADGAASEQPRKKKKKNRELSGPVLEVGTIKLIDEDLTGFQEQKQTLKRPRNTPIDDHDGSHTALQRLLGQDDARRSAGLKDDDDGADDDEPVIVNEAEVKTWATQAKKASTWQTVVLPAHRHTPARPGGPDASPPRRPAARHDSPDASPPRRPAARHDSPDASPPRRPAARHDSPDASPPRRPAARHDSPDASPPRRPAARHDSPDASPPGRPAPRHDSPDASLPRRPAAASAEQGLSVHRAAASNPDMSPPRRPAAAVDGMAAAAAAAAARVAMADGTATGLVSAAALQAETARMKVEQDARRRAAVGRGAETVYRDKVTGKVVSAAEAAASRKALGRDGKPVKSKEELEAEQHLEWRGGLAQQRAAQERAERAAAEVSRPFARYADDAERDAMLRSRSHFGDPMAGLVHGAGALADKDAPVALTQRYSASKLKKSGFLIPQDIPAHSWLKRGVAAPANRYNIRPGRHWDGVDRSNGTERERFKYQAMQRAQEQEARMWSQEDM